jgi:hypothetical protein
MRNAQIDRILSKDFKWKRYWNKPLVIFFLLTGLIMIILCIIPGISLSDSLWGFFLLVGIGFFICGFLLLDIYFLGGPITTILSIISVISSPGYVEPSGMTHTLLYTKIEMDLDLMKRLRPYLIDRYIRPEVNKETDRWIIMEFKNMNRYKYDKKKGILWIFRGKRTKDMLDLEYYDIFNELKTMNR